ncbi:MAG TPA: PEP/pyruvate-binding domain-containing protein, partial [Gemmatimonadaceae bacterium]|nr:PEP/pyruvate-binding domain-containing protein [Gemmatimonadaceae bacterium]
MLDDIEREAQAAAVGVATRDGPDQRAPAERIATAAGTVRQVAPESYVRWFDGLTRSDVAVAGGKGANLAELARAGIPVPPGFVVTVGAYERFAEAGRLTTEIAHRIEALNVDDT